MSIYIVIALILLIGSAFFSASETALTGSSKSLLLHKEQHGSKRAKIINNLIKDYDSTITCLLIGNNLCNIILTTTLTMLIIKYVGSDYIILWSLLITFVILVLAEILPKTFSFTNSNNIAIYIAPILYILIFILKPIAFLFLKLNSLLLNYILRADKSSNAKVFGSVDNLRGAIEMYDRQEESSNNKNGLHTSQEKAMLHGVLDLNEVQVSEIINHRKNVFCVDISKPYEQVIKKILSSDYTRIPVYKNNLENIVGVINVKEVFSAYLRNPRNINLEKLIKPAYFTPESTLVIDVLMNFRLKEERMALIVDEYGSFMGIITLGDILEEITGELKDTNQDNDNDEIYEKNDSFIISGDLKIRDLNRKLNLKFPDEDFTTVAGLILYETEKIPNVGNVFVFYDYKFEILEKRKHQLTKIKMTPISSSF